MVATAGRSPSLREIALSIILVASAVCLVAGLLVAGQFLLTSIGDEAASGVDYVLGFVFGVFLYGPTLIWAAWPVAFPAIMVVGIALAFARHTIRIDHSRLVRNRTLRIGRIVLLAYAVALAVSWAVWLLGAR